MSAHVQSLIDELLDRMPFPTTNNAAHRVQCLRYINNAEKWISQQGSFLYLSQRATLIVANTVQQIVAPSNPQFDAGKTAVIIDDQGPLDFRRAGDFDIVPKDTAYAIRTTRPSTWTLAMNGAVLTIYFDRANLTLGNINYVLQYQRTPVDLADTTGSFSLLPEGYEKTILLDRAEIELKRVNRIPVPDWKLGEMSSALSSFLGAQLITKPEPTTADEIVRNKQYETQLAPGV